MNNTVDQRQVNYDAIENLILSGNIKEVSLLKNLTDGTILLTVTSYDNKTVNMGQSSNDALFERVTNNLMGYIMDRKFVGLHEKRERFISPARTLYFEQLTFGKPVESIPEALVKFVYY